MKTGRREGRKQRKGGEEGITRARRYLQWAVWTEWMNGWMNGMECDMGR